MIWVSAWAIDSPGDAPDPPEIARANNKEAAIIMLVGVDIGGTFTDLVLSENGQLVIHKLPSTPTNPADAMIAGLGYLTGDRLDQLTRVAHGSTVATNAILERRGAKVAFITTQGFRDLLFIGRQDRPGLYALHPQLPEPLVPRDQCYEVPERLDHNGAVITPLDRAALDEVLDRIAAQQVDAVAVCLLYSYLNPEHEQAIRERIQERGMLEPWQVAVSSEVLPEFREYERASTVVLEAYVRPVMSRYIGQLEERLPKQIGLRVMKSDGGVISAERVRRQAVQTALSGPAAGVIGAYEVAQLAGFDQIITLDMGGTSTDVAVCPDELVRRSQSEIDGLPLRMRLLDIETIGAGGGSIARLDAGGALRVGPQSAGAEPGPAVYGRGGTQPTVSDANAILGRLDAANFLGGGMALDVDAGQQAIGMLADAMGVSLAQAAQGIIDIANANIDRALRRVSVARGHDPRDFTLVTFGGAGGLHACDVADRLQIPRVLVPRYPGVLCAFGLLVADVVIDYSWSIIQLVNDQIVTQLADGFEEMITRAKADLLAEGISERDRRLYHPSLDLRYHGQAYELNVPASAEADIRETFHSMHERTYGYALRDRPVELVNLRLQAVGVVAHPHIEPEEGDHSEFAGAAVAVPGDAIIGEKTGADGMRFTLIDRANLTPGGRFQGPALVFQLDSTTYVPVGWSVRVDGFHNLILERH